MSGSQTAMGSESIASPRRWFEILGKIRLVFALALLALMVVLAIPFVWEISQSVLYQEFRAPRLERALGFDLAGPVLKFENGYKEVPVITPIAGGFMARIGFRKNDIILSHSTVSFYKMLYKQPGQSVTVEVIQTDLETPIQRGGARSITFTIPE